MLHFYALRVVCLGEGGRVGVCDQRELFFFNFVFSNLFFQKKNLVLILLKLTGNLAQFRRSFKVKDCFEKRVFFLTNLWVIAWGLEGMVEIRYRLKDLSWEPLVV